jgi:hypothetical protein
MTSLRLSKAADINTLSQLRVGSAQVGSPLLRELVRSADRHELLEQIRVAVARLADNVANVARDDSGDAAPREKAAEFLIHLRSRGNHAKDLAQVIDRVAEAAAAARYRSGAVLDFLAVWLFLAGEEFIAQVDDSRTRLELEVAHSTIWNRFRSQLLEILEATAERLRGGRRARVAETYLARFRLVRARNEERIRSDDALPTVRHRPGRSPAEPDYVVAMVVDLFALALDELGQDLVVSLIPPPQAAGAAGITAQEHHRLWQPLRAVRIQQGYEHFARLCQAQGLAPRAALTKLASALETHLKKTFEWFFPGRNPYGLVRGTLAFIEAAGRDEQANGTAEETAAALFRRYAETMSFMVKLATEDSESATHALEREDSNEGVIGP